MEEERVSIRVIVGRTFVESVPAFLAALREVVPSGVCIQAFDAKKVASEQHIRSAVQKALRAFRKKRNISQDLSMEMLLYAAGERQISRALEMGISEGEQKVVIAVVDPSNTLEEAEMNAIAERVKKRMNIKEEKLGDILSEKERKEAIIQFFGITKEELEAVGEEKIEKLVLERVALLDVKK